MPAWKKSEILGFQVLAETVENRNKKCFGAGGEKNGPELTVSGRID